jgi:hypothetical protein
MLCLEACGQTLLAFASPSATGSLLEFGGAETREAVDWHRSRLVAQIKAIVTFTTLLQSLLIPPLMYAEGQHNRHEYFQSIQLKNDTQYEDIIWEYAHTRQVIKICVEIRASCNHEEVEVVETAPRSRTLGTM